MLEEEIAHRVKYILGVDRAEGVPQSYYAENPPPTMSCLSLSRLASLISQVNFLSCTCQAAPRISIVPGSVDLSNDEGDTVEVP